MTQQDAQRIGAHRKFYRDLRARLIAHAEGEARLAAYGMKLGTAYQIYDDCLDLVGSEEIVGKTLRTDAWWKSPLIVDLGFAIHSVELDELEKAGGSLRCMIGEIY